MPRFDNENLISQNVGHFGFSTTRIEDLGATEYTLVTVVVDTSGSVQSFARDLEKAIQEVVSSCQLSPRADNLMMRLIEFNSQVGEIHGFKLLSNLNLQDYVNLLQPRGQTALYDGAVDGIESLSNYGQQLLSQDFLVNGLLVVITDGEENCSTLPVSRVRDALAAATSQEKLESLTSILIGVNDQCAARLNQLKNDVGFSEFLNLKDTTKQSLAKLAKFISRSISATSASVGSGAAPQSLTF